MEIERLWRPAPEKRLGVLMRDRLADHRWFTSFQFVKLCVEGSLRLAVAETQHPDVSFCGGSKIYSALQPNIL
jgi:hypothetical protein